MKTNEIFKNKVVAVTGGASGIGAAICHKFGEAGARIAIIDMNKGDMDRMIKRLASNRIEAIGIKCDVSRQHECEAAVEKVMRHYGGIDVLVNNAGITQRSPFVDTDIKVFRRVMDINFFGSLYCTKAAISSLVRRKGIIIVISSHAGYAPLIGRTGYSASKHALHGLFESLRTEVKADGVHVMMVCPGFTKTSLQKRALGADGRVTAHPQSTLGALDSPSHVAKAIFRGARKRKNIIVLTPVGKITYLLHRLAPGLYEKQMAKKLRSEIER